MNLSNGRRAPRWAAKKKNFDCGEVGEVHFWRSMIGSNLLPYSILQCTFGDVYDLQDDSNVHPFQFLSFPKFLIENNMRVYNLLQMP